MRKEFFVFLLILVVAGFFRFYHLPLDVWYIASAITGILVVFATYILTKQLFEWRLAALASLLVAVSFWPVALSRMSFDFMLAPLVITLAFYCLWKGFRDNHIIYFLIAGLFLGLGIYTQPVLKFTPIVALILFINYWSFIKSDYALSKYEIARAKLLKGFAVTALIVILFAVPIFFNLWIDQSSCFECKIRPYLFGQSPEITKFWEGFAKTMGMFLFTGDNNPVYNIPGATAVAWPLVIFFVIGFGKELRHWVRRKHDHVSPVHTFLFSWFFITLIPAYLSPVAPDSVLAVGVLPVVMIFTAKGIWWVFEKISHWHHTINPAKHRFFHGQLAPHAVLTLIVFIGALIFSEFWRYFKIWPNLNHFI